jgi:alkanesulfonate monooxygenase SsuD/methylene tetrahydromethanopterin reductase-like flavin-dependent oxidoreductase (luciferase family)
VDVGIGLPSTIPGVEGRQLTEWARRAEQAGFSSLGTIDRIVYPNYEPLIALAAAAAVTERIRLVTSILIAPLRLNDALLAKQAATIQDLSGGRLVLGLAPGGREDDFEASKAEFGNRGSRFARQLENLKRFWGGEHVGMAGAVGPSQLPPPQLVIGGSAQVSFARVAAHADGWIMGGGSPEQLAESVQRLMAAWHAAGRDGKPRVMALGYFALGDDPEGDANRYLTDYYAFLGDYAQAIADSSAKSAEAVAAAQARYAEAGCDELIWFPSSADPEQVRLLAEAAL